VAVDSAAAITKLASPCLHGYVHKTSRVGGASEREKRHTAPSP